MNRFLTDMAASSERRAQQARRREPLPALMRRARERAPAPPLKLSPQGFDIIAELKLRSPAAGALGSAADDWLSRVRGYARGGAAAVSVLTEPDRFDGSLEHLEAAAQALAPLGVPAMRKDFLVDPYQVWEARACGAGGVLVILRMLDAARIVELLDGAAATGLFVLLEAFDAADLGLAQRLLSARATVHEQVLVGINCRDLQTLQVVPQRFAELAALLPPDRPGVAESGVQRAADAAQMAHLGYRLALIGSALMSTPDPARLIAEMLEQGRKVQP